MNYGYGLSVLSKLKETKVKRNLYYEIKDKVLEETVDNGKIVRKLRKTKVFGLHSTKEIRDQLIELLMERVRLHKDKFISPILHAEMRGMEVKKNGFVGHSDLTHDDQVFSYLMALYVWYYGKNLRENFGIQKMGIKTEEDIDDIVELEGVEDNGTITEEFVAATKPEQDKLELQLAQMEKAKGMLFSEYVAKQRQVEEERLQVMMQNKAVKEAYARKYGMDPDAVVLDSQMTFGNSVQLPNSLFTDFIKNEDELDQSSIYYTLNHSQNVMNEVQEDESQQ